MADHAAVPEGHHGEDVHHDSFWRKYIFSTDHKIIGIQYGITALLFLLFGFSLVMLMRWQLAYPGEPVPLIGWLFTDDTMPGGIMLPEFYNQLGAMHGTIMVFLGIVPLAVGAFGNYIVPLQIGAPDMAFPKLNMASYWAFFVGGVVMLGSFFVPAGAAKAGWTSYAPLSVIESMGQTMWLLGMIFLITSSLLGAVNFLTTIVQLRAEGMTFMRMPFFVWAQFITSFLLLLAFPPLEAAAFLQLSDRLLDTSFFMPSGLVVSGEVVDVAGGGSPLLWQHLFWFLAHPEVYVLVLPAMGIVAEIIANNSRRPLRGFKAMVYSLIFLGFMSFIVWAHHMFITGMGQVMSVFFQTTTMIISIPSVIILTALFLVAVGRFHPVHDAHALCAGLPAHVRYRRAHGTAAGTGGHRYSSARYLLRDRALPLCGGAGHYSRAHGRHLLLVPEDDRADPERHARQDSLLGHDRQHEFHLLSHAYPGVSRRFEAVVRRGEIYAHAQDVIVYNEVMSIASWVLFVFQIPFIVNLLISMKKGKKATDNHWDATTLEWSAAPSPPVGHGNFHDLPQVYRDPYEYSHPDHDEDYWPQNAPPAEASED